MNLTLYQAYTALSSRIQALTTLANNLANTNAIAYKADRVFEEALRYAGMDGSSPNAPQGAAGVPVTVPRTAIDFTPGTIVETSSPLHLALNGQGFFAVQAPQGVRYTRQGNFQLSQSGQLQTAEGYPVLGEAGPIQISGNGAITIDNVGHIATGGAEVGRLKIVDFKDRQKLLKEGMALFNMPEEQDAPAPAKAPNLRQGALENSNVNPVSAMTELMIVQREFESLQKSILLSMNDMSQKLIDEAGKR
jgi:flagellar basal-body rod protein FlgF